MSYRTDIFGYVLLATSTVNPVDPDAYAEIQAAIDLGYRTLVIGSSSDEFTISQPLDLKANKTYVIDAKIKIKDGSEALLTSDLLKAGLTFTVDHPELFAVGDWIGITDDASGTFHLRQNGSDAKITDITEATITVDRARSNDYLVEQNAFIGHIQSVVIINGADNIKIIGSGELNQNKDNQSSIYALTLIAGESILTSCGLCATNSDNLIIDGITCINGLMHNFNFSNDLTNLQLSNLHADTCIDKNILIRGCVGVTLNDILCENAIEEDGLIFYSGVVNAYVNNITCKNNDRYGFAWGGETSNGLSGGNITVDGNLRGVNISAKNVVLSNIVSSDSIWLSAAYTCKNITLNNVEIIGAVATNILYLYGNVKNIDINNLTITGCNGVGIKSIIYEDLLAEDVVITGGGIYDHTGVKVDLAEGTDVTFTDFEGID